MSVFIACADAGEYDPSISVGGNSWIQWACANSWEEITKLVTDLNTREEWAGKLHYIYELEPGEYNYKHRWEYISPGVFEEY